MTTQYGLRAKLARLLSLAPHHFIRVGRGGGRGGWLQTSILKTKKHATASDSRLACLVDLVTGGNVYLDSISEHRPHISTYIVYLEDSAHLTE
jgi:hypothetical protein